MFTIGNQIVGGNSVFIVAEGCDNHMGSIDTAMEMVKLAKLAGADAIKFQHHLPDDEMLPDVPMSSNFDIPLYEFLKKNALTLTQHEHLKKYCETLGICYMCTPFCGKAAEELNSIGVSSFKIGSGEMTDIPTLLGIAKYGKPMIISTGMCTFDEIDRTYHAMVKSQIPFSLTNCLSEYPPEYKDMNLKVIEEMIRRYPDAVIGHSDHTPDLYTSFAAVVLGAKIIEKHVILSKQTKGPDQAVSIDFYDLHCLVDGIRKIELSLGSEKVVNPREKKIREWAFHSIVSITNLKKGAKITGSMIGSKRPGTGIAAYKREQIIGRKLARDIEKNKLLFESDLESISDD